ncbi:unnamed protein product [Larinioides sclopetarius]|uniref:Uncharacterized protein n=1 Tax=Larinioides sclopetarius TaxID=280406 RepID=A0AAV1ZXZ3_9ARAC
MSSFRVSTRVQLFIHQRCSIKKQLLCCVMKLQPNGMCSTVSIKFDFYNFDLYSQNTIKSK